MKKIFTIGILLSQLILSATFEQVEQFMMVTNAENEMLRQESDLTPWQIKLSKKHGNFSLYPIELITSRFREYIQTHLSDNEMDMILKNHIDPLLQRFITENNDIFDNKSYMNKYMASLDEAEQDEKRLALVKDINREYYEEHAIVALLDEAFVPILKKLNNRKSTPSYIKRYRKDYIKGIQSKVKKETFYATREFSIAELEELLTIMKTPAMGYEVRAFNNAKAYALKELMYTMAINVGYIKAN